MHLVSTFDEFTPESKFCLISLPSLVTEYKFETLAKGIKFGTFELSANILIKSVPLSLYRPNNL